MKDDDQNFTSSQRIMIILKVSGYIAFSLLCDPTLTLFELAYANADPQESKSQS